MTMEMENEDFDGIDEGDVRTFAGHDYNQTRGIAPIVAPSYTDPTTGAVYIHRDLGVQIRPWEAAEHIPPRSGNEKLGDVESWAGTVNRENDGQTYATWNTRRLLATFDYDTRGRHHASMDFVLSRELVAWKDADHLLSISQAIQVLEDQSEAISDPTATELMGIIRSLRANVSSSAETELRPDGTMGVSFARDQRVTSKAGGSVELPHSIKITIPVLAGEIDTDGKPVRYAMVVRLRASVSNDAALTLRFTVMHVDRIVETVVMGQVSKTRELISPIELYRAAL